MITPRKGQWFARPRPVRWTVRALPVSWWTINALYIGTGMVLQLLRREMPEWAKDFYFTSMLAFAAGWLVKITFDAVARRRDRRDRALSDAPGIVEHPVEIVIVVNERLIGSDRGIVWFEDDLLHYSGAATSFVLSAEDIVPRKWLTTSDPYADLPRDALRLNRPEIAYVRVRPLLAYGWRYRARLRRFLRDAKSTILPRQWPPLRAYGEEPPKDPLALSPEQIGAEAARTGSARGVIRT